MKPVLQSTTNNAGAKLTRDDGDADVVGGDVCGDVGCGGDKVGNVRDK